MRCGICGDPFDSPTPRPNEMGGKYYTGIISDKYQAGQVRTITVELTANHRGYFEFKLCPVNGNPAKETEECLKNHPIEVHTTSGSSATYIFNEKNSLVPLISRRSFDNKAFCVLPFKNLNKKCYPSNDIGRLNVYYTP